MHIGNTHMNLLINPCCTVWVMVTVFALYVCVSTRLFQLEFKRMFVNPIIHSLTLVSGY